MNPTGLVCEISSLSRHYQLMKPKLHLWILVQMDIKLQLFHMIGPSSCGPAEATRRMRWRLNELALYSLRQTR
uniref:Uncharacterized protein n=1 Tax=Salix viminalis TaxID=40686 RepID=A0A6N2LWX5_SALVM